MPLLDYIMLTLKWLCNFVHELFMLIYLNGLLMKVIIKCVDMGQMCDVQIKKEISTAKYLVVYFQME